MCCAAACGVAGTVCSTFGNVGAMVVVVMEQWWRGVGVVPSGDVGDVFLVVGAMVVVVFWFVSRELGGYCWW
ncbi:Hypothetical predicted protein [Olea europaea subsp. europaea]|uniref:Transmembrane protein n=1 Tax=Olea europaea subsp. europaea TaxID=158383 RepID=A0A8S0Q0U9_OLEEU|nr:Hypothetical predicted protein [Olea europaea subsp. europaea]